MFLLDVNCLVALGWPNHVHHQRMRRWFRDAGAKRWATTVGVQTGFIRVSMNALVTGNTVTFPTARSVLSRLLTYGEHRTVTRVSAPTEWPDWIGPRLQGYRQVSDALLIATAVTAGIRLATLDEALLDLTDAAHRGSVFSLPV